MSSTFMIKPEKLAITMKNHKTLSNYLEIVFFVAVVFIFNGTFFHYDYHMDDAWVVGTNYVSESIFSQDGIDVAVKNIAKNYYEQWGKQHRFIGILPFIRLMEILISSHINFHLILNLLFHAVNSLFLYKLLTNRLECNKINSFLLSTLCALGLNTNAGVYALTVWIGSFSVNLLTLFFIMYFLHSSKKNISKYILVFVYIVYFLLAFGDYSIVVILPALTILIYLSNKDIFFSIKYFLLLSIPILVNLIIVSFAPASSYIGTIPNFHLKHIIRNVFLNTKCLIGGGEVFQIVFVIFIITSIIIGLYKKRITILQLLFALSLIYGYIFIYSLSARNSFENPYFLYIPYFGLIVLIALAFKGISLNNCFVIVVILLLIGNTQYSDSREYRAFRDKTAAAVEIARKEFFKIEKLTFSPEKRLIILLYKDFPYRSYPLGYFDSTYNTWKDKTNKTKYVIATDYAKYGETIKFKVGINQYNKEYENFMSIDEILHRANIQNKKYRIVEVINNKYTFVDPKLIVRKNISYQSKYGVERYGNGKLYSWTDGKLQVFFYCTPDDIGKFVTISFTITSLFNDDIKIISNDLNDVIHVYANDAFKFSKTIKIKKTKTVLLLKSEKTIKPKSDTRLLSFRIDNDLHFVIHKNIFTDN